MHCELNAFAGLVGGRKFLHHLIEIKARGFLPDRVILEAGKPLRDDRHTRKKQSQNSPRTTLTSQSDRAGRSASHRQQNSFIR